LPRQKSTALLFSTFKFIAACLMLKSSFSIVSVCLFLINGSVFAQNQDGLSVQRTSADSVSAGNALELKRSQEAASWWSKRYLIDYSLVVGGTAGYIIGKDLEPRSRSLIGPSYDPDNLLDLFRSDYLNEPYLEQDDEESVPEYWIHRSIAGVAALLIGLEAREWTSGTGRGSGHGFHNTVVGYAESVALTATFTDMTKPFFARLRPDFRERALRFHCSDLTSSQYDPYCEGYRDVPLDNDPDEAQKLFNDGRKSFISGHSSHSFNLFGYAALSIGGRYVWGSEATSRSRRFAIPAQAVLISTAVYFTGSRIHDGRHHHSDVLVGATVGAAISNFSYWRRFNRDGKLRNQREQPPEVHRNPSRYQSDFQLNPVLLTEHSGGGIQLLVRF
jgi:membrane-associated phospholipid phosphatase